MKESAMSYTLFRSCAALLLGVSICLGTGCGAARNQQYSLKGENPLSKADSWESNRAIMLAAMASDNPAIVLSTGQKELEARPDNVEARTMVAQVQTRLGQPKQALLTLDPVQSSTEPSVKLELARARLALGHPEQAVPFLNEVAATENAPLVREASKLLAVACDQQGRHAEAQKRYEALLASKNEPSVRYNYGRSLMLSNKNREAAAILLPMVDSPEFPQARLAAAAALARSNDKQGARNLLEGYLSQNEIERILGEGE